MTLLRPCLSCGTPAPSVGRCTDCQRRLERTRHRGQPRSQTNAERGYGARWQRLSRRARRLQPFCIDDPTGATCFGGLTADHLLPGKVARTLRDVAVRYRRHNALRGQPTWDEAPPVALLVEDGDEGATQNSEGDDEKERPPAILEDRLDDPVDEGENDREHSSSIVGPAQPRWSSPRGGGWSPRPAGGCAAGGS
jgi:hypothetical protein